MRQHAEAATKETAYERLGAQYRRPLMAFFQRRLISRADAEDMTQDVFLRLIAGGGAHLDRADAYIFQIASNLLKDRLRRERVRFQAAPALDAQLEVLEAIDPARILISRDQLARVQTYLGELPRVTRNLFILFRLEGVPQAELAVAYAMSVRGVQKHILKAMQYILKRIDAEEARYDGL